MGWEKITDKISMNPEACIGCGLCIEVCPTEAIQQKSIYLDVDGYVTLKDKLIYINPDECVSCGACVPGCPTWAISDGTIPGGSGNGGNNGGSTGGGNGGENPKDPKDIKNEDLKPFPCAYQLVQDLPNLDNNIGDMMKSVFQNNDNVNIKFRPKSGMGNVDGTTFASYTNMGTFNATININEDILNHATKEYILVTLYHEVLHAYLGYEKFRLGDEAFYEEYPSVVVGIDYDASGVAINRFTFLSDHGQLGPYINDLQGILLDYNPSLPPEVARAMAKAGITKLTPEESALNGAERDTSKGKSKGSVCL